MIHFFERMHDESPKSTKKYCTFCKPDQHTYFTLNTRVMRTKLTLTVEKNTIEKAKIYAQNTGRSLSNLVENYLESIIRDNKPIDKMSPKLRSLVGSVKLPKHFDEKKEIDEYYRKKHL